MQDWRDSLPVPVEIRPDNRFLCPREDFAKWAEGRHHLRMETFYRGMRKRTGLLMEKGEPLGGRWNFDAENRKKLPKGHRLPEPDRLSADSVTREAIALVETGISRPFRRSGGLPMAGDARGRPRHTAPLHRGMPSDLRRLSGRNEGRRALPLSRPHLARAQCGASDGRGGMPRGRTRPIARVQCRCIVPRGLSGRSSVGGSMSGGSTGLGCPSIGKPMPSMRAVRSRGFIGLARPSSLHPASRGPDPRPCLCPPYPAADGDGQLCPLIAGLNPTQVRSGISSSSPTPMSGWSYPTSTAWFSGRMAV